MIGLIWNSRGVGKKGFKSYLQNVIQGLEVDFLGIQETMRKTFTAGFFRGIDPLNQFAWKWVPSYGKSGGILGGFRIERFDILDHSMGRYHIKVKVWDTKLKLKYYVIIVYGSAQEEMKDEFLVELGAACGDQELPMLVGGDFNILRFDSDKNRNRRRRCKKTDMLNAIINTHELREIVMSGGQFTWSNNHVIPTLEKLDRILVSSDWEDLFPLMTVRKLVRELSDHNPLIIDTMEQAEPKRKKEFRFDVSWCKHPDFLERVRKVWEEPIQAGDSLGIIQGMLKEVKNSMKGWGHNLRGQLNKRRKELADELHDLEEIQPLSTEMLARRGDINAALFDIYDEEEEYWQRKAGQNWLQKGDNNTTYFHRIANGRKRKNTIFSLQNGEDVIQGTYALLEHATDFYKKLFGHAVGFQCQLREDMWAPAERLTLEEQDMLDVPFTEEEVKGII